MTFIGQSSVCVDCGTPLVGAAVTGGDRCDECMVIARPWKQGRAALLYCGKGRDLILALKHGDRPDIARPAGIWMARAASDLIQPQTLVVPVPLHWRRLVRRRFNQSALLARALAREAKVACCPDLLQRTRATPPLDGRGRDERFAVLRGALTVSRRRRLVLQGRPILLVDDVMTSGATFAAATEACLAAGSGPVCVVSLARVAKTP